MDDLNLKQRLNLNGGDPSAPLRKLCGEALVEIERIEGERDAARDELSDANSLLELLRLTMGVEYQPHQSLRDRMQEKAALVPYAEKQSEALHRIATWADAYPLEVFPEPDLKRAAEVLKAAGITLDSISAYAMRHVITQVGGIAKAALDSPPSQGGECAGLAPPAGCRWPKTCGAQLAEAAVREEGEGRIERENYGFVAGPK